MLNPAAFDGGEDATPDAPLEDDWWELPEIGITELRVHPMHLVTSEDRTVVNLCLTFRGGGLGGAGPLPFAGGVADQPACLWRAFGVVGDAVDKLKRNDGDE